MNQIVAIDPFIEQYAACKAGLPGAAMPWLCDLREAGIERFAKIGRAHV